MVCGWIGFDSLPLHHLSFFWLFPKDGCKGEFLLTTHHNYSQSVIRKILKSRLYLNDEVSSVTTPIKELKAFQRVSLEPGEQKTVKLTLPPEAFSLIDAKLNRIIEPVNLSI
ncbi:MAG: fibronectin type III-like domain-contianing protein [Kiritimatiellaceae bacterium]|nr:fibronectin type III-like domain-contianing protein [Kiritimatiellaceae bacterium]